MATVIYNCKRCKQGKRVEYSIERAKGYFYRLDSNGVEQPAARRWSNQKIDETAALVAATLSPESCISPF